MMTKTVEEFFEGHWKKGLVRGTVWDCSHLTEEDIDNIKKRYPEVQWDMRLKGLPQLGSGAVFDVAEKDIKVAYVDVQPHWKRLMGIDFSHGGEDPTVVICAALDPVKQFVYLYNGFESAGNTLLPDVARKIVPMQQRKGIPLMRPADSARSGNLVSGESIKELYEREGVVFEASLAGNWHADVSGKDRTKVVGIEYIRQLMHEGRFKVDASLEGWFKEYRQYCWVKGKLIDKNDHWMDCTRYVVTALETFGVTESQMTASRKGGDRFNVDVNKLLSDFENDMENYVL